MFALDLSHLTLSQLDWTCNDLTCPNLIRPALNLFDLIQNDLTCLDRT